MSDTNIKGSCLCNSVQFSIKQTLQDIGACHCIQCQKSSGHYWVAGLVKSENIDIQDTQKTLKWYESSKIAKRGFCSNCGSFLFWATLDGKECDVSMGAIDNLPANSQLSYHIWTEFKQNYYEIADNKPQFMREKP